MFFPNHHQIILGLICLFALLEFILLSSFQFFAPCQSHQELRHFLEYSSIIALFITLIYFLLQQLKKTYVNLFLIFFNIYIVVTICLCLYWLINLAIESRRFFDQFSPQTCSNVVFYFFFICLIGNYFVFLLLITSFLCSNYEDKQGFYAHVNLIH